MNTYREKIKNWFWFNYPSISVGLSADIKSRNAFDDYSSLLGELSSIPDSSVVHLVNLMNPGLDDKKVLSIRHDVDSDLATALKMSEMESKAGLVASYYFLPSAPYFRYRTNSIFERSPLLAKYIQEIDQNGGEIGLHLDCLNDSLKYGLSPRDSLNDELEWMRSTGVVVNGCASHGSYHLYGADNYEIFEGFTTEGRSEFVDLNGKTQKLGTEKMTDYGLKYEANYLLGSLLREVPKNKYAVGKNGKWALMVRAYDYQFSILAHDEWCASNHREIRRSGDVNLRILNTSQMIRELIILPTPCRIVIDIHPIYYGRTWGRVVLNRLRCI